MMKRILALVAVMAFIAVASSACDGGDEGQPPSRTVTEPTSPKATSTSSSPESTPTPGELADALAVTFAVELGDGATCLRLFKLRNDVKEITPNHPAIPSMNDELLRIGCLSASDSRTDSDRPNGTEGLDPINYNASYTVCAHDPAKIYGQSGTSAPEKAAAWMAEGSRIGVARDSSYQGCLDALTGIPSRFGEP